MLFRSFIIEKITDNDSFYRFLRFFKFRYVFCFAFFISLYGLYEGVRVPDVRNIEIAIKDLPEELEGLTLVQLSDLHIGPSFDKEWLEKVIDKVEDINADYVFITGDMVDGPTRLLRDRFTPLTRIKDNLYVVYGNHDYYSGINSWKAVYKALKINTLLDERIILEKNGKKVSIIGFNDYSFGGNRDYNINSFGENIEADLVIGLSHQPLLTYKLRDLPVDLMLSGHTHGVQFFLIFYPAMKANKDLRSGKYIINDTILHINEGPGLRGGMSFRIGKKGEISQITLRSE